MAISALLQGAAGSTAIDSVGNLFGQLTGNIYNSQQTWKQREANYQMTDYLYEKDLENWNRQNEYNSPAAQMQRFKDAGLNPALMYDKGTPGLASTPPPAKEANQPGFRANIEYPNVMAKYQDFRLKQVNIDAVNSVIAKNAAETDLKKAELIMKGFDIGLKPEQIKFALEQMNQTRSEWPYDLEAKKQGVEQTKKNVELLSAKLNLTNRERDWLDRKINLWDTKGLNIDHVPWYLGPASKLLDKLIEWIDDGSGDPITKQLKLKVEKELKPVSDASDTVYQKNTPWYHTGHHWSR